MQVVLYKVFLWFSIISLGLWVGGTVFHMLVLQPMWSYDPPASVRFFFKETRFNHTIWNFYGPPWMATRILPMLLCIAFGWNAAPEQRTLLLACGITWIAITAYTVLYIYPINEILFTQAGGDSSPAEVTALVKKWLFADRLRFVIGTIGYICLLKAFTRIG